MSTSTTTTTAVATTTPKDVAKTKPKSIQQHLEADAFKMQVARVLPKHLTPERFIRVALTAMTRTPDLKKCDQASVFSCLLNLSQLGIEADGRRAHLIPFNNTQRGCLECTLILDYKGLAELAMRSGLLSNIHADVVCDNDEFEYDRGELKKHKIDFRKDRGEVYAVYSLVRFKDGSEKCDVMSRLEVEMIRKRSKTPNKGPWVSDWNEMAKKTVFRRLSKWLPLSPEFRDGLDADADEQADEEARFRNAKPVFAGAQAQLPEDTGTDNQEPETAQDPEPDKVEETKTETTKTEAPSETVKPASKESATTTTKAPEPPQTTSAPTEPTSQESKEVADHLTKLVADTGVDGDTFLRWLNSKGLVSSPMASIAELVECSPRKAKSLIASFGKYRDEIIAAKK